MTGLGGAPLILGIESSCDEMAAAVLRGGREILSSCIHGQAEVPAPYGGIVPRLAQQRGLARFADAIQRSVTARYDESQIGRPQLRFRQLRRHEMPDEVVDTDQGQAFGVGQRLCKGDPD